MACWTLGGQEVIGLDHISLGAVIEEVSATSCVEIIALHELYLITMSSKRKKGAVTVAHPSSRRLGAFEGCSTRPTETPMRRMGTDSISSAATHGILRDGSLVQLVDC